MPNVLYTVCKTIGLYLPKEQSDYLPLTTNSLYVEFAKLK